MQIEARAGQVAKPAIGLDIDETVLSNWQNIIANNFGFIKGGECDVLPAGPCGFDEWILKSAAPIRPAVTFFKAAKERGAPIVFITGRRKNQRAATMWNLDRAGFEGWAKLAIRADKDNFASAEAYKTDAHAKVVAEDRYTIIANIGDQESDLAGGNAECTFKLPNPFYFIP